MRNKVARVVVTSILSTELFNACNRIDTLHRPKVKAAAQLVGRGAGWFLFNRWEYYRDVFSIEIGAIGEGLYLDDFDTVATLALFLARIRDPPAKRIIRGGSITRSLPKAVAIRPWMSDQAERLRETVSSRK